MSNTEIATKWLICDVDGTLTPEQLLICLLEQLARKRMDIGSILDRAKPLRDRYRNNLDSFQPYIEQIVEEFFTNRCYEGIEKSELEAASKMAVRLCKERTYVFTRELIRAAKNLGYKIAIVSGSPVSVISAFLEPETADAVYATEFVFDDQNVCTGDPVIEYVTDKNRAFIEIEKTYGPIDASSSIVIGDTRSDAALMRRVNYPIAYNPKGQLKDIAVAERFAYIVETQDGILVHRFGIHGERIWQPSLIDVVPPDLATPMLMRLKAAGWPIV